MFISNSNCYDNCDWLFKSKLTVEALCYLGLNGTQLNKREVSKKNLTESTKVKNFCDMVEAKLY